MGKRQATKPPTAVAHKPTKPKTVTRTTAPIGAYAPTQATSHKPQAATAVSAPKTMKDGEKGQRMRIGLYFEEANGC
ncbi:hypothetical protein IAR50_004846 [Cryptococcus sp. DSM 104548]